MHTLKDQKGNAGIIVIFFVVVAGIMGAIIYFLVHDSSGLSSPLESDIQVQGDEQKQADAAAVASINNVDNAKLTEKNKTMESDTRVSKNGDVLVMNYTGRLTDGTVFDSNVDPKFNHVAPFEFKLGAGMVIKGWDEGLLGMKIGEKKTLTIPPEKGYGAAGAGSRIPPNSTLVFDVELVGIK